MATKNNRIQVMLEDELAQWVKDTASADDRTVSEFLRLLIIKAKD